MAESTPSSKPSIPLRVVLSAPLGSTNSRPGVVVLHLTITNVSPSTIYLLRWQSPIDSKAVALGVFKFKSTSTETAAPCLNLKINRKLPSEGYFSVEDDSIVRIDSGGKVEREVAVGEPEVELERGEKYEVRAEGRWMGVWVQSEGEGPKERLPLDGDGSLLRGEYVTDAVVVVVPGDD